MEYKIISFIITSFLSETCIMCRAENTCSHHVCHSFPFHILHKTTQTSGTTAGRSTGNDGAIPGPRSAVYDKSPATPANETLVSLGKTMKM